MNIERTRTFKPAKRRSSFRDARLIIVATEDTKAEPTYFKDLAAYFRNPKLHVEVLSRLSTASSPEHVMAMLDSFMRKYRLKPDDELWMVIDVDSWGEKKLGSVAKACMQKKYNLAVSNPSSDLWFLLHGKDPVDYPVNILDEFFENRKENKRTRLELELISAFGKFSKKNLDTMQFIPFVKDAINRARNLDLNPQHRWPVTLGTRLYLLAEKIIEKP